MTHLFDLLFEAGLINVFYVTSNAIQNWVELNDPFLGRQVKFKAPFTFSKDKTKEMENRLIVARGCG